MNILFYRLNGIVPENGGISRITANLCKIFRERGHDVWFVGSSNKNKDYSYDNNQLFLPNIGEIDCVENVIFLTDFIQCKSINIIINQFCASYSHVSLLDECRKKTNVKVVFCYHNSILTQIYNYAYTRQFIANEQGYSWLFNILNSWMFRKAILWTYLIKNRKNYRNIHKKNDAIVLLCEGQVCELERAIGMSPVKNSYVIYNSMSSPGLIETKKEKWVLWVGSFDYQVKRPDNMLRIWGKVESNFPEWNLIMMGDGASFECCKKQAKKMRLHNVVFEGRVNPVEYYKKAEIICMTSVHECFPMVLLEGMNFGLALVAFDSFTSAKLLVEEEKNGRLVKAFDIDKYAETLTELLQDKGVREKMQNNSLRAANRFTEERIYSMWMNLFSDLLV